MPHSQDTCYEFGPFRLDAERRVLTRSGEPASLTPKAGMLEEMGDQLEAEERGEAELRLAKLLSGTQQTSLLIRVQNILANKTHSFTGKP